MSQQFLDRAQVGAVRQQMRGVGVTETVRVQRRISRQACCVELHDAADASCGQPRAAMIRTIMLNHWYHHRGQLSVYLRLLDVRLPVIYGRSADTDPFA